MLKKWKFSKVFLTQKWTKFVSQLNFFNSRNVKKLSLKFFGVHQKKNSDDNKIIII